METKISMGEKMYFLSICNVPHRGDGWVMEPKTNISSSSPRTDTYGLFNRIIRISNNVLTFNEPRDNLCG
jgi:hypothetical protein